MAGAAGSGLSKGGMKTKLLAARTATAAGCDMAITEGSVLHPITALENGAPDRLVAQGPCADIVDNRELSGTFGRGDAVDVIDASGAVLGQGLTRYDASDAARIKGLRSDQIEAVLGYPARGPLIHRDDMAI